MHGPNGCGRDDGDAQLVAVRCRKERAGKGPRQHPNKDTTQRAVHSANEWKWEGAGPYKDVAKSL